MARRFWENVRAIRLAKHMSQAALARALGDEHGKNTNISTSELHDPRVPRPDKILRLAEALGASTQELMRDVETPYDVLRASTNVAVAREELKRFEVPRSKKETVTPPTAPTFQLPHHHKKARHAR